jgi:putative phosphoesterase
MRILIFSDLHANLEALIALQRVEKKPDAVLFLGDALGYGPDPMACVSWLKSNATLAVRGNLDGADNGDCMPPLEWRDVAEATRTLHRATLPAASIRYLNALNPCETIVLGGARFRLSHCAPNGVDALTASEQKIEAALQGNGADVILSGHTHVPSLRRTRDMWLVNPGSLGQPRHGLASATYAVWEDGDLKIQHIDYDSRATIEKLSLLPLDPEHVTHLKNTLLQGM